MLNQFWRINKTRGFTLIELLVVAAIISILLALAIPNLLKARISSNEANARKSLQTVRDAEYEFFEQDLDGDGERNFTDEIGTLAGAAGTLRNPTGTSDEEDALIDSTFEGFVDADAGPVNCPDPKASYCIAYDDTLVDPENEFGWQASMTSAQKVGRKDFSIYMDKAIRCTNSSQSVGSPGMFESDISTPGCD
ncbi:MAG: type IV pilin protein [Deltaproteobacteria bacterium]